MAGPPGSSPSGEAVEAHRQRGRGSSIRVTLGGAMRPANACRGRRTAGWNVPILAGGRGDRGNPQRSVAGRLADRGWMRSPPLGGGPSLGTAKRLRTAPEIPGSTRLRWTWRSAPPAVPVDLSGILSAERPPRWCVNVPRRLPRPRSPPRRTTLKNALEVPPTSHRSGPLTGVRSSWVQFDTAPTSSGRESSLVAGAGEMGSRPAGGTGSVRPPRWMTAAWT